MNFNKDLRDSDPEEREISLGTATIVGIFLALALICAAFFGFGYSLGRHSNQQAAPSTATDTTKTDSPFSDFKAPLNNADDTPQATAGTPNSADDDKTGERAVVLKDTAKTASPAKDVAFPVPSPPARPAGPAPAAASGVQDFVQVSATSRQGDAEALIAALKQKGYSAAIRQEPQDKLFHVQLGPFANKQTAEAMRKRLDTDGYRAIVK